MLPLINRLDLLKIKTNAWGLEADELLLKCKATEKVQET